MDLLDPASWIGTLIIVVIVLIATTAVILIARAILLRLSGRTVWIAEFSRRIHAPTLTVALIVAVVGEMIASQPGLGQAILLAARAFRASDLFAGIALLGAIGFLSNALLAWGERRLMPWQRPNA